MAQRDNVLNQVWDVNTLSWVREQQAVLEADAVTVNISEPLSVDDNGGSLTVDLPAMTTASGTLTSLGSSVTFNVSAAPSETLAIQLSGTWSTTIYFAASIDGTNYEYVGVLSIGNPLSAIPAFASTIASNGIFLVPIAGFHSFRIERDGESGSGTVAYSVRYGPALSTIYSIAEPDQSYSALSITGGGAETTALRVTLANNSTGLVSVDDNGSTLSVDDGAGSLTVDGTVSVTGVATAANQTTVIGHLDGVEGLLTTIDADTGTLAGAVAGSEMQVDVITSALPSGAATAANQSTGNTSLANIEDAVERTATATLSNVAGSASSVQLLASTAGRKAAYFYNDSSAACYVKLGTTASTSSFTVKMAAASFYELPAPCYTGKIDAIWDSATGNMRVTELT